MLLITTEVKEIIILHIDRQPNKVLKGLQQLKDRLDLDSKLVISTQGLRQMLQKIDWLLDERISMTRKSSTIE